MEEANLKAARTKALEAYQGEIQDWGRHHRKYLLAQGLGILFVGLPALLWVLAVLTLALIRFYLFKRLQPEELPPPLSPGFWTWATVGAVVAVCLLYGIAIAFRVYVVPDRAGLFRRLARNGKKLRRRFERAKDETQIAEATTKLDDLIEERDNRFPPNTPFDQAIGEVLFNLKGVLGVFKMGGR